MVLNKNKQKTQVSFNIYVFFFVGRVLFGRLLRATGFVTGRFRCHNNLLLFNLIDVNLSVLVVLLTNFWLLFLFSIVILK
jgi:hypothetical protein